MFLSLLRCSVSIISFIASQLYEFNDNEDSGILPKENNDTIVMGAEHFDWTIANFLDEVATNSIIYSVGANGYHDGKVSKNGTINITVSYVECFSK